MDRQELLRTLALQIAALHRVPWVHIAIDGLDAAAKTPLADELAIAITTLGRSVIRASIDGFHNPSAVRRRRGPDSPEGYHRDSFNYAGLFEAVLRPLGPGGSGRFRRAIFDFRSDRPVDAPVTYAPPDSILLFDGVFLLRHELRESGTSRSSSGLTSPLRLGGPRSAM